MSMGGPVNSPLDTAVRNAIRTGLSIVVATGHESQNTDHSSPSRVLEAVVVGAVDGNNKKARFSNFGPSLKVWAPGVGIPSAWTDGPNLVKKLDGTSMAAYVYLVKMTKFFFGKLTMEQSDLASLDIWPWHSVEATSLHRS